MTKQTKNAMNKIRLAKKAMTIATTTAIIASTVASPIGAFATSSVEGKKVAVSQKVATKTVANKIQTNNLIKNPEFAITNGVINNWSFSAGLGLLDSDGWFSYAGLSSFNGRVVPYIKKTQPIDPSTGHTGVRIHTKAASVHYGISQNVQQRESYDIVAGKKYTLSFKVKSSNFGNPTDTSNFYVNAYFGAPTKTIPFKDLIPGQYNDIELPITAKGTGEQFTFSQHISGDLIESDIEIADIKLTSADYSLISGKVEALFTSSEHTDVKDTTTQEIVDELRQEVAADANLSDAEKVELQALLDLAESLIIPKAPAVNRVTSKDTTVTGKALPNAEITLETRYQASGQNINRTYETTANENGEYSVTIPTQPAGSKISVKQTRNDKTSELTVVNVMDADLYPAPIIQPISSTDTLLRGTATAGATIDIRIGDATYSTQVTDNGAFTIDLQRSFPRGTEITAVLHGDNEKTSTPVTVTVGKSLLEMADEAVDNLFDDASHTRLADDTDQAAIDAAQALVDRLPAGGTKAELQDEINKAKELLIEKEAGEKINKAQEALDALFEDESHQKLADGVTQGDIDAVQALINDIPAGNAKKELQDELDKAQRLFDETEAGKRLKEAEEAVDNLFKDAGHTQLADSTDQAAIDAAQALVDQLPAGNKKNELQDELDKAQVLLDKKEFEEQFKEAQAALDNLFKDDAHTELADGVNQGDIDAAQDLIDALPAGNQKDEMQAEVDKAQALLKEKEAAAQLKAAQDAVNALFTTSAHTALAPGVNQASINSAKALVDALPASAEKTALLVEITKAQKLLDDATQITAPTIDKYTEKDAFVTGKTGKNTAYVGLFVNGVRVKLATPDTSGNYKIAATGLGLTSGTTFEVRAYGTGNIAGPGTQATVEAAAGESYTLTAGDTSVNADFITGDIGSSMDTVKLSVDGVIVKIGQITNGTYKIASKGLVKAGSVVQVIGYKGREEIKRIDVANKNGEKVQLAALTTKDDMITGSVTPGSATKVRISINGTAVKTATIQANGTFASSIGKQVAGTIVKVEVYENNAYNELRSNTVTVTGEDESTKLPKPIITNQSGDYINGTVSGETSMIVLYEDGVAKRTMSSTQMTSNPDGTLAFSIYVTKGTKSVQVLARNADKTKVSDLSDAFQMK